MRMQRTVKLGTVLATLLLAGFCALAAGCGPEDYGPCTLPRSEALDEACSSKTTEGEAGTPTTETKPSCVIDFVFECENQLCGTFKGSDAFCTERCDGAAAASCPESGVCVEWVPGLGEFYCVPRDLMPELL